MNIRLKSVWSAFLVAALNAPGWNALAQEPGTTPAMTAEEAEQEFQERIAEYKSALLEIEQLRGEYQTADAAGREQINAQLAERVATTQALVDAMVAAATEAYRLAPDATGQAAELLKAMARYYAVGQAPPNSDGVVNGGDQYELALPIIQLLLEKGADEPQLPIWAFVSAFTANDYDLAEQHLQKVQESGVLATAASTTDEAEQDVFHLAMQLSESIDHYRELWTQESAIRAAEAKADDLPRVRLMTSKGEIVLELFENDAPQAVANFITLVKEGFYAGLSFHRVLHCFMAQGGCPIGDGSGGPGYSIRCECYEPDARHHFRGSLSMAHAGRDTGGSQFFLTFVPTPHLDGKHTVFGRVIKGMDVLGELQKRSPTGRRERDISLPKPDKILAAEVIRDRGHEYTFDRLPAR